MKLIEAEKVERAIKDYWKAQVNKALTLTDGNEKRINIYLEHNHELLKAIDGLPSIQPDTTTNDSNVVKKGGNGEDRTTDDLISRQAVLNATSTTLRITGKENAETVYGYIKKLCDDIKALPSVQPERKMGHWVLDRSGRYCCNRCMEPCATYAMMKPRDKFCKMCGSRNEVQE